MTAETEAEHERQSAAGTHLFDEGCRYCCAAELDRLRAIVNRAAGMGLCSQTHHEHLMIAARAALQPEGSARDGG